MGTSNVGKWSATSSLDASAFSSGVDKMVKDGQRVHQEVSGSFGKGADKMIRDGQRVHQEVSGSFGLLRQNVDARMTGFGQGLKESMAHLQGGNLTGFMAGIQGAFAVSGAAAGIQLVQRLGQAVADYIKQGLQAIVMQEKFAKAVGVSRESAAAMIAIGAVGGASPAETQHSVMAAQRHIGDLRRALAEEGRGEDSRGGEAGSALRMLGLNPTAFATMRSWTEQVGILGDRLNTITDAADRTSIARAILGRDWESLQPQLRMGSEGLARMAEYASQLGVTLSGELTESITSSSRAHREFAVVQQLAADGIRNQFTAGVQEGTDALRRGTMTMQEFIAAQRQAQVAARGLGQGIGELSGMAMRQLQIQISNVVEGLRLIGILSPPPPPAIPGNAMAPMGWDAGAPPGAIQGAGLAANEQNALEGDVDRATLALRRQVEAYGLTANEVQRLALVQKGATDQQLADFDKFARAQERQRQDMEAMAQTRRFAEQARSPLESLQRNVRQWSQAGLNQEQLGRLVMGGIGESGGGHAPLLGSLSAEGTDTAQVLQAASAPQVDRLSAMLATLESIAQTQRETREFARENAGLLRDAVLNVRLSE